MRTQLLQRRGTSAEWAAANPILGDGEIGFDRTAGVLKVGDGVKHWSDPTITSFTGDSSPVLSVAGRAGDVVLTAADIGAGTFPGASYQFKALSLRSGASATFTSYSLGRISNELDIGVAALGAQWFGDAVVGDIALRVADSSKMLRLGVGVGPSQLRISNSGVTVPGTLAVTGLSTLSGGAIIPISTGLLFNQASGNQAYILGQGTVLKARGGSSGFQFANNADTLSIATLGNNGDLSLHGSSAGLIVFGRDNDTQNYVWYTNANIARLYSSTALADRLSVDSSGNLTIAGNFSSSTSGKALLQPNGDTGGFLLTANGAANKGLVIRTSASTTANAFEIQNSSGSPILYVDSSSLRLTTSIAINSNISGKAYLKMNQDAGGIGIFTNDDFNKGLIVRGNSPTQSADLQQWQDSAGNVLFKVKPDGGLALQTLGNANIEIGRQDGVASSPFIDFHSGAVAADYDVRLLVSGGTGIVGQGTLTATGKLVVQAPGIAAATALTLNADGSLNNRGPEIAFIDQKAGQTTPNKFIRVLGGNFQLLNNGYNTVLLQIDDSGNLVSPATAAHAFGYLIDPALTGAYLQINPSSVVSGALLVNTRAAGNIGLVVKGVSGQTSDLFQLQNNLGGTLLTVNNVGFMSVNSIGLTAITTKTTAVTGGAAAALPTNPVGYVKIPINGVDRYIPYYS